MSLWACYQQHQGASTRPDRQALADTLSGNLCRCTGYRPILDAGQAMFDAPPALLDPAPVIVALRAMQADPPLQRPGYAAPRGWRSLPRCAGPPLWLVCWLGGTDLGLW
jgi:xanthine dehydrogenase small subunit